MSEASATPVAPAAAAAPTTATPASTQNTPDVKGAAPATPPTPPKTYRVKVNGSEVTMTEAELLQSASLGKAAFQRMEEAGKMRQQLEGFLEKFRQDPLSALENPVLGLSEEQRRDMIERYYQKKYLEQDALTPEQKKQKEVEAELERYRAKERKSQEESEKANFEAAKQVHREQYVTVFTKALDASGLPKTPATMKAMAFYVAKAAEQGIDAPLELVAKKVREDYQSAFQELTSAAGPEMLLQFMGSDVAKKIRQYDLEQYRARQGAKPAAPSPAKAISEPQQKSITDALQERREKFRQLNRR